MLSLDTLTIKAIIKLIYLNVRPNKKGRCKLKKKELLKLLNYG